MARFDRLVNRNRKGYKFTHKPVEEVDTSWKGLLKEHFSFKWVRFNVRTVIAFILAFMVTTLLVIPMMMKVLTDTTAFILGHAVVTAFMIVVSNTIINKEKIDWKAMVLRYVFIALLLASTAYLSLTITSWFN